MKPSGLQNETFKLLHLSDDSKSLSDLELPEIVNQRKRKVRRKTRPKAAVSNRYQESNNPNQCNKLIMWIAIFLSSCWLLTLSYMMAVIHAENVRLEVQINKQPNKKASAGNGVNSQDQLLSPSTDEQEDFGWPKVVRNTSRTRNRKFSFIRLCGPLIFVTCISLSLGFMYWLYFDLRQQLYDYRQKIEEASVTSQNLQQALQKWHEISKNLEKNQTDMYGKILELRRNLDNLSSDFSQYKDKYLNEKKDYTKDEKTVADFGAKLASIEGDVDLVKERFDSIQKEQADLKDSLLTLKTNFSDTVNRTAVYNNFNSTNCTAEIAKTKKMVFDQIQQVSTNLSSINDFLTQKINGLDKEVHFNTKTLENVTERSARTMSHVQSIEGDWVDCKNKFLVELENTTSYLSNAIKEVQTQCNKYAQVFSMRLEEPKKVQSMDSSNNAKEKVFTEQGNLQKPQDQNQNQDKPKVLQLNKTQFVNSADANSNSTVERSMADKPKTLSPMPYRKQNE